MLALMWLQGRQWRAAVLWQVLQVGCTVSRSKGRAGTGGSSSAGKYLFHWEP